MASIRKQKVGWRAEVCVNGVRESATRDTKQEAEAWAAMRAAELRGGVAAVVAKYTVRDVFLRYQREVSPTKRGARWEMLRIDTFLESPLAAVPLPDLAPAHVAAWRDSRLASVKSSTVNRDLNVISNAFEVARREWGWLQINPCSGVRRPKDPPPRDRRISDREIEMVRLALNFPDDGPARSVMQRVAVAFLFAIETAMRLGEICNLTPADIVGPVAALRETKNGRSRQVPLSSRALELISMVEGVENGLVFGMSSEAAGAMFRKCVSPVIHDLTFHDTRHEAITRLADRLDVLDLARMVGHTNLKMLMVYYNRSALELAGRLG